MKINDLCQTLDFGSCFVLVVDSAKDHKADAVIENSIKLKEVQEMDVDRIAFFKELQVVYQQSDCMEDFMVEGGANNVITVFAHTPGKKVKNTKLKMEQYGLGDSLYKYVDDLNDEHDSSHESAYMYY